MTGAMLRALHGSHQPSPRPTPPLGITLEIRNRVQRGPTARGGGADRPPAPVCGPPEAALQIASFYTHKSQPWLVFEADGAWLPAEGTVAMLQPPLSSAVPGPRGLCVQAGRPAQSLNEIVSLAVPYFSPKVCYSGKSHTWFFRPSQPSLFGALFVCLILAPYLSKTSM